ncbi:hypothetical protein [Rhodoferax sp. PAMC 29310]|uniref:hypothetical protein n=1 Tax=Rhodoferax sp. PAMC 29310 TaxID=2822760 RepID=UPI001B32DDE9|nr:hypothetical protein [Rhodoferax sp. PAMC 29310]
MTSPERLLNLDQVEAGMRLARPVNTQHGQLILPEGAPLDMAGIYVLNQRGVTSIWVEEIEPTPSNSPIEISASNQSIQDRLTQLFRQSSNSGDGRELLELVQRYRRREFT